MAKILVVEDEHSIAEALIMNLEDLGHEVCHACTGQEGVDFFARERPDIVLLDLMLPELPGKSVLKNIRQTDERVPVLVITARDENIEKIDLFRAGIDDYLCKPFALNELIARVERLLTRAGWSKGEALSAHFHFDGVDLFFDKRKAEVRGLEYDLTEQEIALLRYFVGHPGEIISRETLIKDVLGYDSVIETRTIDNFMVRFRKYFEIDPKNPRYFQSHRGVGYSFHPHPKDEA